MKVIIIDDEKAMHIIMKRMLSKVDEVEVMGNFQNTATAYSYLTNHDVDLIFMDISMPKESGLEFAARLREEGRRVKLVFVTSHTEFALPAFDVYAYDFLVKPIVQGRLMQTIQRALSDMPSEQLPDQQESSTIRATFNCFGGLEIRTIQNELVKWKTSKSAELFGYLLLHKGRLVARSRVIEDIFGDMPPKNGETYLNTTVYQLRRLLDNYGLKMSLYSDGSHYALELHHVSVDLLIFEEGCKRLAVINDTNITQALELEQMYVGDLFGDRVFTWASSEVERLLLMYTSLTKRLCYALLVSGDIHTAIRLLKKLIVINELDEEANIVLMKALALQKNKEGLTRQYIQFSDALHRELRIGPSLEAADLYRQLLDQLQ